MKSWKTQGRYWLLGWLMLIALSHGIGVVSAQEPAELVNVRKIWDAAPHNAFTDLIRFQDRWICVFREGTGHVSPDGALRVIQSSDGLDWESLARIESADSDLRDAKISVTPDGRLMLSGAEAMHDRTEKTHQSLAWFSDDGREWSQAHEIGDPDFWLWRTTWHAGTAYSIGYGCGAERLTRLYTSRDGREFDVLVSRLTDEGYPNETSLVFLEDTAYCLLRRDGQPASGLLGRSTAPFDQWEWQDLQVKIGGPCMLALPDGRMVAAVRLYDEQVRTSLCWVDVASGKITEFLKLPSGGDTSYAGMVWHAERLWVSYYSSHEGKSNIYFAEVRLGPADKEKANDEKADGAADEFPPLARAHAHNDYYHTRPLLDALGQGFTSVEADVFLVGGELLVGHSQAELQLERTLESLYLKPLSERAQRNGGSVFAADSPAQLLLHIDVKTTAVPTFQAIHDRLQKYPELFTPRTPQDSNSSPVRVVISGNRDYQQIVSAKPRWAGIDGRMKDLPSELAASDMPLVSDAWHTHFTWRGVGEMPADEKAKLRDLVGRAHHEGRQVRFWATPEKPELWMELQAADVDWINTDRLEQLREYLTSNPGQ